MNDVAGFKEFLQARTKDEVVLSRFSFVRYKEFLVKKDYAVFTINKKVNSLLDYNQFLHMGGLVKDIFIDLKRDRVPIATGSEQEVQSLIDRQVESLPFYVEDIRKVSLGNKLIVYLLLYIGVSVTELVNIKLKDVDVLTSTVQVVEKGGKHREIGLSSDVL